MEYFRTINTLTVSLKIVWVSDGLDMVELEEGIEFEVLMSVEWKVL